MVFLFDQSSSDQEDSGNQEDSVMLNKSSVDRGMFVHTCFKTLQCEENKKTNCTFEKIEAPPSKSQNNTMNYSKLGDNGIIKKGTPVVKGDIIIGKTLTKVKTDEDDDKTDCSLAISNGEEGIVDDVWEGINDDGNKMVKVRIRQLRVPEVGDKLASRSSQKGVCGLLLNQEDMPFTTQGITPDLLINPHCLPSRMTMSQLIECLLGKTCSMKGKLGDSTAFTSSSINPVNKISDELARLGYERHGNERMYCGYTGEMLEAEVFIGPTYYQRLKHLVKDKMHCLTLDHQVLTRNGWKNIYEISLNDKVATLNKKGELEYQSPTHVWKYENYDGMMYHIKNQAIDLSVTGNHRMWVSSQYDYIINNYDFENAEDIVGKVRRYKSDAIWNEEDDLLLSKEKSKDLIDSLIKHTPMTLSKTIADKIQHLCLHAGYSCIMNELNENEYEVFINKFNHNPLVNVDKKEDVFVHEVCDVMCITVPNEVFYVRRNGKAVWTGNSRSRGNVTMMHHQPSEGRSRDGGLRTGVFISLVIVQITTLC